MFDLSHPWWEFIVRALVVYLFLLIILRLTGKRQFGQMSPFDLVLLLIISNAVQNSMNAGDNSLAGGLISAVTLLGINYGFGYLTSKSRKLEHAVEGRAEVLIHNGKLYKDVLEREKITNEEMMSALRHEGIASVDQVDFAILENDGRISVKKRREP